MTGGEGAFAVGVCGNEGDLNPVAQIAGEPALPVGVPSPGAYVLESGFFLVDGANELVEFGGGGGMRHIAPGEIEVVGFEGVEICK